MRTSENGISKIKHFENEPLATVPGFIAHVYDDNGAPAIAYGHRLLPGESFPEGLDELGADSLMRREDLPRFESMVNAHIPADVTPKQGQFDALVSFAYNIQNQPQSLIQLLGHGWDEVPNQLPRWCHKKVNGVSEVDDGLLARRQAEVEMWNS